MSKNYFQILEVGKNVGKFILGEALKCRKMTWPKYKNVKKWTKQIFRIKMHGENFMTFLPPFSDIFTHGSIFRHFFFPETKKSRILKTFSGIFTCNPSESRTYNSKPFNFILWFYPFCKMPKRGRSNKLI